MFLLKSLFYSFVCLFLIPLIIEKSGKCGSLSAEEYNKLEPNTRQLLGKLNNSQEVPSALKIDVPISNGILLPIAPDGQALSPKEISYRVTLVYLLQQGDNENAQKFITALYQWKSGRGEIGNTNLNESELKRISQKVAKKQDPHGLETRLFLLNNDLPKAPTTKIQRTAPELQVSNWPKPPTGPIADRKKPDPSRLEGELRKVREDFSYSAGQRCDEMEVLKNPSSVQRLYKNVKNILKKWL